MSYRRIAALLLVGIVTFVTLTLVESVVGEAAELGDRGAEVTEIQQDLRSFGYSVTVDGVFGLRTLRAVKHFQRVNGLVVDGVVGPATQRALEPAVRGAQVPVTQPVAPAPVAASGPCSEWADELAYFGMPATFQSIMFRESRCNPGVTSNTGCCRGLLQVHSLHLPKPECRAYSPSDLFDPAINICVASILYKSSGMAPWAL